MQDNQSTTENEGTPSAASPTPEGLKAKFRAAQRTVKAYQEKIRPYQDKINKVRIIMYAIAIPWAVYVGVKSLPYYAAIGKGESYFKQGLYNEAEKEFLFCYEECKTENPKDPRLARVLNNLGIIYRGTGRYRLAEPFMKESVEIAGMYFPKKQEYPMGMSNQGALLNDEGKYAESEQVYRKALHVWKDNIKKESDSKLASIYNGLARSLREQGKLDEAETTAQKALAMKEKESGKNSLDTAQVLENLGKIAQKKGQFDQSQKYFESALEIDRKAFGERHPDVASDECGIGRLYLEVGKLKEAKTFLQQSLATRKHFFKAEHPTVARTLSSLGELNIKEGDKKMAIANLNLAFKTQTKFLGVQHPDTLETKDALKKAMSMPAGPSK